MTLTSGTKLGHYEILSPLGAGGMGEVYRARDTKLSRNVALKVLPEAFVQDPDRMARFEREAKLLASLNHPNIASIYGLEDSDHIRALVMELVEGPTLAGRIQQGAIAIDEVVSVAKQLCEALEYAHERGIIHRDLKPANIKLTSNDKLAANNVVKILDFGLAKALEGEDVPSDIGDSPTFSGLATQSGMILGTAGYMSPEQAKGRPVDRRTDIWAFGCVLYEMLTGRMAFRGETNTDTLAAVLKEEPDWSLLPVATPPQVRSLLHSCLKKDVKQRLQAIGDARIVLEEVSSGAPQGDSLEAASQLATHPRRWLAWGVAALLSVTLLPIAFLHFGETHSLAEPVRFQIPLPIAARSFSLSPNGRLLTFTAPGLDGRNLIWIRALDALEARPLPGTEDAFTPPVFWSPDSRFIAFQTAGKLKKIDVSGGPPQTICDIQPLVLGGAWSREDVIIFGTDAGGGGIMRVPSAGGVATPLTTVGGANEIHVFPSFLPDGQHFVYLRAPENPGILVGSLNVKPEQQSRALLLPTSVMPTYAASPDPTQGRLLFMRESTLMEQSFDVRRMELVGEPVPVADRVGTVFLSASFSTSANDILAYRSKGATTTTKLTWFDRAGKVLGRVGDFGAGSYTYTDVALSPDGKRVAATLFDPSVTGQSEAIWLHELARSVRARLTFNVSPDTTPVWSPDGRRIAFMGFRAGGVGLYQKASSGAEKEEVLLSPTNSAKLPNDWSHSGQFLLYSIQDPKTNADLWVLPLTADGQPSGTPAPFANTKFNEQQGQFSPDGHWIAYVSDESGRPEIHVQPFPVPSGGGSKIQISRDGGDQPRWRRDGKELFYLSLDGKMMEVDVGGGMEFDAGAPRVLFQAPILNGDASLSGFRWDVATDGKRFLVDTVSSSSEPLTVVLNWTAGLKK